MKEWSINAQELRQALADVFNQPVETIDVGVSLQLAARIAQEKGSSNSISERDIYESAQRALVRLGTPSSESAPLVGNGYHYLNGDRESSSATLLALSHLLSPEVPLRTVTEVTQSEQAWTDFLGSFQQPARPWYMQWGARLVGGTVDSIVAFKDAFFMGPLVMTLPFEGVDIRFNTLVERAIGVVKQMSGPPTIFWQQVAATYEKQGRPIPPNRENARKIANRLSDVLTEYPTDNQLLKHIKSHPPLRDDVEKLFRFIAAFGEPRVARPAAEVLAVLHTDIFSRRAEAPIGQKTHNFPQMDGANREEVLSFLRGLIPQLWEKPPPLPRFYQWIQKRQERAQKRWTISFWTFIGKIFRLNPLELIEPSDSQIDDEVWDIWDQTWNLTSLQVADIVTDLDDLLWKWGFQSGIDLRNEKIRLRKLIISYTALALRDKTPLSFASHSTSTRLADIANTPALAAVRLALFLRTVNDPDVTREEIEGMEENYTYGELAADQEEDLVEFQRHGHNFDELDKAIQLLVAFNLTSPFKDYVRGSKGLAANHQKILIDDSMSKARHYVLGGGLGAVVTGHHDFYPVYLLKATALLKRLTGIYPGSRIIFDLSGSNGKTLERTLRVNVVSHAGTEIATDFRQPTVSLQTQRSRIDRALKQAKRYEEVMEQARQIVKDHEKGVLVFRVETDKEGRFVLIQEIEKEGEKKVRRLTVLQTDTLFALYEGEKQASLREAILLPGPVLGAEQGVPEAGGEPQAAGIPNFDGEQALGENPGLQGINLDAPQEGGDSGGPKASLDSSNPTMLITGGGIFMGGRQDPTDLLTVGSLALQPFPVVHLEPPPPRKVPKLEVIEGGSVDLEEYSSAKNQVVRKVPPKTTSAPLSRRGTHGMHPIARSRGQILRLTKI